MSTHRPTLLASIERATGLTIQTARVVERGAYNVIVIVNDDWIFRFPRALSTRNDHEQERLRVLASFAKVSPLPVPAPIYVTDDFVGYKKIAGAPLYPTQLARLPNEDKLRIAKQLGTFLSALHHHEDKAVTFHTGYLPTTGPFNGWPDFFAQFLDASECRNLEARLQAIVDNPANGLERTTIIHGDFYSGNILWNKKTRVVTGVIDWSSVGRGIPAMDFIGLADFTTNRNDRFLEEIVRSYGADDALFSHVKETAILDVINWYWAYSHRKDQKGMRRIIKRLKMLLRDRR